MYNHVANGVCCFPSLYKIVRSAVVSRIFYVYISRFVRLRYIGIVRRRSRRRRRCCCRGCCCSWILAWLGWHSAVKVLSLNFIHMYKCCLFFSFHTIFDVVAGSLHLVVFFFFVFCSLHSFFPLFVFRAHKRGVFYFWWFWIHNILTYRLALNQTPKIHKTRKFDAEDENETQWRNNVLDFCCGWNEIEWNRRSFRAPAKCVASRYDAFGGKMQWREWILYFSFLLHWINFELILRHFLWIFAVE